MLQSPWNNKLPMQVKSLSHLKKNQEIRKRLVEVKFGNPIIFPVFIQNWELDGELHTHREISISPIDSNETVSWSGKGEGDFRCYTSTYEYLSIWIHIK